MYATDFEYDGKYLSDYGFIICTFDDEAGASFIDSGSKITFNKTSHRNGSRYSLTSSTYDECFTTTFDICKNPDIYEKDMMYITNDELRDMRKWLGRKYYRKFQFLGNNVAQNEYSCFYNASFNIELIEVSSKLCGLRLTMDTDMPYGYANESTISLEFDGISSISFEDFSEEEGIEYPSVKIECRESGNLEIYNETCELVTVFKNCEAGEIIEIDGFTHAISTSRLSHSNILKDFNYIFPVIRNTFYESKNVYRTNKQCLIEFKYNPIIKDFI